MCVSVPTGINQFNPMTMQNAQMSQAPMGARAPSPMNHPQQMNMSSVPAVRSLSSLSLIYSFSLLSSCFCEPVSFSLLSWLFLETFFSFSPQFVQVMHHFSPSLAFSSTFSLLDCEMHHTHTYLFYFTW